MKVSLVTKTVGVNNFSDRSMEELIIAQARVSSDKKGDELFKHPEKLLRHLINNLHWSPFDMCGIGFNIETSRAMAMEFIRHFSIHPQMYSQRYSNSIGFENIELRIQSKDNRQSSTDILLNDALSLEKDNFLFYTKDFYERLIQSGVAREVARFILPETSTTILYMNGTVRSWITFLNARLHKTAQKEIRLIAEEIKNIFIQEFPFISEALYNFDNAYNIHVLDRVVLEKYGVYQNLPLDK